MCLLAGVLLAVATVNTTDIATTCPHFRLTLVNSTFLDAFAMVEPFVYDQLTHMSNFTVPVLAYGTQLAEVCMSFMSLQIGQSSIKRNPYYVYTYVQ